MVRLGDYIEVYDLTNVNNLDLPFFGINKDKTFMPTVADTNGLDRSKYKVVEKDVFVFSGMQTGRDVCIRLALYDKDNSILVSPAYTTFIIKNNSRLLTEYLFIQFNRFQMDRYGWFLSDGSVRSNLDWDVFCNIQIPLPDIDTQQELVDTYNGLKALAEQNEALIEPLTKACQAYLIDCKKNYPEIELEGYIEPVEEKNKDLTVSLSQGISNTKEFQSPKQVSSNSRNDKIVRRGQFAYNRATTRNGEKISIAYRFGEDCTVSSAYQVFKINNEAVLNPIYLLLWFKRSEFDRYARYMSKGSAHEFFEFDEMCRIKIPLPPSEVQNAIVNLYSCSEEAKRIADDARKKMKTLCPALVQKAISA